MSSTFHGLEVARRALNTQQSALHTTGHNIANANTPGYSRQRVNFTQTQAFPTAAMNRPEIPGQLGTGVQAGSIQRIRESFLDDQFRNEVNKLGYWEARATSLSKMEDVVNEPTSNGLAAVMGEFWQSLQDLSVNPENTGARGVALERGQAVVDTFHYLSDSLTTIQKDIGSEIGITLQDVNSLVKQIGEINGQIFQVEPHGYLPNDLYDKRDALVDELSQLVNIKVTTTASGGNNSAMAEGLYNISMVGADGKEYALVTGDRFNQMGFSNSKGELTTAVPDSINSIQFFDQQGRKLSKAVTFAGTDGKIDFAQGKLRGMIESYSYSYTDENGDTVEKGIYPEMIADLDKQAFTFANVFNAVHEKGYDLQGNSGKPFFELQDPANYAGAAKGIQRTNLTTNDVAASMSVTANGTVNAGNGQNAINLSNIQSMILTNGAHKLEGTTDTIDLTSISAIDDGTLNSFYEGIVGRLGVNALQANRMGQNSLVLSQSVEEKRQSVSSVSLDEEMSNMIQFQHAYNAAARNITMVDEMLDKIINGMGLVGR